MLYHLPNHVEYNLLLPYPLGRPHSKGIEEILEVEPLFWWVAGAVKIGTRQMIIGSRLDQLGSECKATDQDMLSHACSPTHLR